jgi:hypothetical protein
MKEHWEGIAPLLERVRPGECIFSDLHSVAEPRLSMPGQLTGLSWLTSLKLYEKIRIEDGVWNGKTVNRCNCS